MKHVLLLALISFGLPQIVVAQSGTDSMVELVGQMRAKREIINTWAPVCEDGSQNHGFCPFWDMTIFSGMSCLAGVTERCDEVKNSQGPDGRWWRSPGLVGKYGEINTFSRDQAKGALAYLVATKDVSAALRWQAYLDAHKQRMCTKASNNRCVITQGTSRLFGAVWEYLGLKPAKWMNRGQWISRIYDPIEASVQPSNFPMHLNALNAWIRTEIERRGGPKVDPIDTKVVKILVRREPENPFFLMLRDGPTEEVAKIILKKCPDQRPANQQLDWAWQRSQDDKPWLVASGHDCIFIINTFERELALKLRAQ